MYGCPADSVDIALEKEHPFFEDETNNLRLAKYKFNLITGEAEMKYLIEDFTVEFPIINQQYVG
jgi:carotenoid cleavage dioxygenase-like enzyme